MKKKHAKKRLAEVEKSLRKVFDNRDNYTGEEWDILVETLDEEYRKLRKMVESKRESIVHATLTSEDMNKLMPVLEAWGDESYGPVPSEIFEPPFYDDIDISKYKEVLSGYKYKIKGYNHFLRDGDVQQMKIHFKCPNGCVTKEEYLFYPLSCTWVFDYDVVIYKYEDQ